MKWPHLVGGLFGVCQMLKIGFLKKEANEIARVVNKHILTRGEAGCAHDAFCGMLKIEIMELEETLDLAVKPIQGALKDVMTLYDVYNQVKKEMSERDFEGEEKYYWIK